MDPIKDSQSLSRLSAVDITRQRAEREAAERQKNHECEMAARIQLEQSNRTLYREAIDEAAKLIYAEAEKAIKRLERLRFPGGQNCDVVTSYVATRRFLPRMRVKLFGEFHLQATEECTVWAIRDNLKHGIYLASDGKVYVSSIACRSDVSGKIWHGLHAIDSIDIGVIDRFPYYAGCRGVIEEIRNETQSIIEKLRTL